MKPLELFIEGFKSYAEPTAFSFEGRTLFGIVGPTGAGKSSVLDGIIYALYGKTPRIGASTTRLINSSAESAKVRLTFEVDEHVWVVTRVLKRKGASHVQLHPFGDEAAMTIGESNVNNKIIDLVGLDFAAFLSSVTLPQGEFDRFLKASGSERTRILKGIFRLDRVDAMRELAKRKWSEVRAQISAVEASRPALPQDPDQVLEELRTRLKEADERAAEMLASMSLITTAEAGLERTAREIDGIDGDISAIGVVRDRLPSSEEVATQLSSIEERVRALSDSERKAEATQIHLDEAIAELQKIEKSFGGPEWFEEVRLNLRDVARLESEAGASLESRQKLDAELVLIKERVSQIEDRVASASEAAREAESSFDELQRTHAAHALRSQLKAGEHCPVCEQEVSSVPGARKIPALDKARKEAEKARRAESEARAAQDECLRESALVTSRLEDCQARLAEIDLRLDAVRKQLGELVGRDTDPIGELSRREESIKKARKNAADAADERVEADRELKASREAAEEARKSSEGLMSRVIHACGALALAFDPESDRTRLGEVITLANRTAEDRISKLRAERVTLEKEREESARALDSFRDRYAQSEDESVAEIYRRAEKLVADIGSEIAELEKALVQVSEVDAAIVGFQAKLTVLDRLGNDLTDGKFLKFLLDEQRRLLSSLASEKLQELTKHYRYDDEGEFTLIDVRTETRRTPETFSGGETFLASLALALGLSESVSMRGGSLGCFFLDEGFGSLDAESLDLALEGIESLAAPGRIVGLISHVPGIQARLEDLIVLEKAQDGSTIVSQHEGPIGYATAVI